MQDFVHNNGRSPKRILWTQLDATMDLQNKLFMWLIFFLSLSEAAFTSLIKENETPMYSVGLALRYLSKAVFTKALLNGELIEIKVHIFWEGQKILRNLHLTFDCMYCSQK